MWIFTKCGFFSAVQSQENPDYINVRSTFRGDLENLCRVHGVQIDVWKTPNHTYPYHMEFERNVWAQILALGAEDIDYTNFKNAVHDGTTRDDVYIECWYSLQKRSAEL